MKLERSMNPPVGQDYVGKFQGFKASAKEAWSGAKEKFHNTTEYLKATQVDLIEAAKDQNFKNFLEDTEKTPNWEKEPMEVRKAYVIYERSRKVKKELGDVLGKKFESFISDKESIPADLEKAIIKLVKENPQELKRIEKNIDSYIQQQEKVKVHQDAIDGYKESGGEKGLSDKLDTLRKAKSFKRTIYKMVPALGVGKDSALAYEHAKKEHGISSKENIKEEIRSLKESLKSIKTSEKRKSAVKDRFSKQRSEVIFENSIAQYISKQLKEQIDIKFEGLQDLSGTKSKDVNEALSSIDTYNTEFKRNPKKKSIFKKLLRSKETTEHENNVTSFSDEEIDELRNDLMEKLDLSIKTEITEIIINKKKNSLEQSVEDYIRKAEFAGMSRKESIKKVYESFILVTSSMTNLDDNLRERLQLVTRTMAANEYLTK